MLRVHTNFPQLLCIGINPIGLGVRLISPAAALGSVGTIKPPEGSRCPPRFLRRCRVDDGGGGVLPVGVETPLDRLLRSSPPSILALAEDEEEYSSGGAAQSRCRRRSMEASSLEDMVGVV